jgi:hypothetical protein
MTMEYATRKQAMRVARMLGCYGAHQDADGRWMPCATHEEMTAAIRGENKPRVEKSISLAVSTKVAANSSRSKRTFASYEEAAAEAKRQGGSVRTLVRNGVILYSVHKFGTPLAKPSDFERLTESPIMGIDTLPGGGLVSAKSLDFQIDEIDAKGFVNYVSRSTDPDVFTNPESARVRARQLGCIGIRSYRASDGKIVYLPCTNSPDYNRARGLRNDGRPKKKDDESDEKSLAKTPAPKKDRIVGSSRNSVGSASSVSSAGEISVTLAVEKALTTKVRDHNADVKKRNKEDWSKTSLRALKAVYRRGAGAFSVSHRPGMTRNQWAMGRVNAFLRLLMSGSAKASYTTDNDLLPDGHPWKKRGIGAKSFEIDNILYEELTDPMSGVSFRRGQAKSVTRHYVIALNQEI